MEVHDEWIVYLCIGIVAFFDDSDAVRILPYLVLGCIFGFTIAYLCICWQTPAVEPIERDFSILPPPVIEKIPILIPQPLDVGEPSINQNGSTPHNPQLQPIVTPGKAPEFDIVKFVAMLRLGVAVIRHKNGTRKPKTLRMNMMGELYWSKSNKLGLKSRDNSFLWPVSTLKTVFECKPDANAPPSFIIENKSLSTLHLSLPDDCKVGYFVKGFKNLILKAVADPQFLMDMSVSETASSTSVSTPTAILRALSFSFGDKRKTPSGKSDTPGAKLSTGNVLEHADSPGGGKSVVSFSSAATSAPPAVAFVRPQGSDGEARLQSQATDSPALSTATAATARTARSTATTPAATTPAASTPASAVAAAGTGSAVTPRTARKQTRATDDA